MIGSLIGGMIVGGVAANYIEKKRKEKDFFEKSERELRQLMDYTIRHFNTSAGSSTSNRSNTSARTNTTKSTDTKLQKQVEFFDEFRSLDNKLARNVREGYKGVTYLIKGMDVTNSNANVKNSLKNIRNYRNQLSHDKRKWKDVPAPTSSLMSDLHKAINWVNSNYSYAGKLVYKGKNAFSKSR